WRVYGSVSGGEYVAPCSWVERCYACDRESSLFAAGAAVRLAGRVAIAAEVGLACCVFPVLLPFSAPRTGLFVAQAREGVWCCLRRIGVRCSSNAVSLSGSTAPLDAVDCMKGGVGV
ncbi:unnamed protein product, partial [Ectocarpus sp. 13 AM-2016]